jgi:hypothetical protein
VEGPAREQAAGAVEACARLLSTQHRLQHVPVDLDALRVGRQGSAQVSTDQRSQHRSAQIRDQRSSAQITAYFVNVPAKNLQLEAVQCQCSRQHSATQLITPPLSHAHYNQDNIWQYMCCYTHEPQHKSMCSPSATHLITPLLCHCLRQYNTND